MKAIELTQEQRKKLIEMCVSIFPEYSEIIFGRKNFPDTDYLWMYDSDGFPFEIHWFEFCMTYLPVRIFHEANAKGGNNLYIITKNLTQFEDFGRYNINPIDNLYNDFKALNQ